MARVPDPSLAAKRRRQILDAALACFARRGFHQATMQEICTEAGLSAGALYRYFQSKAELIVAIAQEDRKALISVLESFDDGDDFIGRASRVVRAWAEKVMQKDRGLVGEVLAEAARDQAFAEKLAQLDAPFQAAFAEAIRRAQARGEVDPHIDSEQAARLTVAMMDGYALRTALLPTTSAEISIYDAELAIYDMDRFFQTFFGARSAAPAPARATPRRTKTEEHVQ